MGGDIYDVLVDESYFDGSREYRVTGFDQQLLREPLTMLPVQRPLTLAADASVSDAMRAMQRKHTGCVIITGDGSTRTQLEGIFTERDVLFRIVDRGRNPAALALSEVMTPEPETLSVRATVAYVLNKMAVGGFRHVPVVDDQQRPKGVVSVRDVVTFLVDAFPREVMNLPELDASPSQAREGA
ncbi:MAG: CBS domain-containing protein [Myxococcota bacterium]